MWSSLLGHFQTWWEDRAVTRGWTSSHREFKFRLHITAHRIHHLAWKASYFLFTESVFLSIYIKTKERLSNYMKFNFKKKFQLPVCFFFIIQSNCILFFLNLCVYFHSTATTCWFPQFLCLKRCIKRFIINTTDLIWSNYCNFFEWIIYGILLVYLANRFNRMDGRWSAKKLQSLCRCDLISSETER